MDISRSNTEEQQNTKNNNGNVKLKVIGRKLTEEELQNIITPVMHDCYNLSRKTAYSISSFVRFCITFG
jgi:hypothetical protein